MKKLIQFPNKDFFPWGLMPMEAQILKINIVLSLAMKSRSWRACLYYGIMIIITIFWELSLVEKSVGIPIRCTQGPQNKSDHVIVWMTKWHGFLYVQIDNLCWSSRFCGERTQIGCFSRKWRWACWKIHMLNVWFFIKGLLDWPQTS